MPRKLKDNYELAYKDLERANEVLKLEAARIGRSFQDVLNQRESEILLNQRFRRDNEQLMEQNFRIERDLASAMSTITTMEQSVVDLRDQLERRDKEKEKLAEKNKALKEQLERMRNSVNVWAHHSPMGNNCLHGDSFTCTVSKMIFCGSFFAVCTAALMQYLKEGYNFKK